MIAVTFALPNESADFLRRLRARDCRYAKEVRVLHTGVGAKIARKNLANFLAEESPRILISAGFAGATSDQLNVADVLVAENFSEPTLLERARTFAVIGKLKTIPQVADSESDRAAIAQTSGALAIDMETEFIASACTERNIPLLSLRAISDTPRAPFSIPLRVLFDMQKQRTNFALLLGYIFRHPGSIGHLIRVARQTKAARHALTSALDSVLRALN